jgi:hypothetical protein
MAAALAQNGRLLTRYAKLRLNSTKFRILAPKQSLKKYARSNLFAVSFEERTTQHHIESRRESPPEHPNNWVFYGTQV